MPKSYLSDPRDGDEILAEVKELTAATPAHIFHHAAGALIYHNAERQRGAGWAKCKYEIGVAVYDDGAYKYFYDDDAGAVLDLAKLRAATARVPPGYKKGSRYAADGKRPFGAAPYPDEASTFADALKRRDRVAKIFRETADTVKAPLLIHLPAWVLVTGNAATFADGFPLPPDFREVYAGILKVPEDALLGPVPALAIYPDGEAAISRVALGVVKDSRRSALAELKIETDGYTKDGAPAELTGDAIYTLLLIFKYIRHNTTTPEVKALIHDTREIWLPRGKADLYGCCYDTPGRVAPHKRITRGLNKLTEPIILIRRDAEGRLVDYDVMPCLEIRKKPGLKDIPAKVRKKYGKAFWRDYKSRGFIIRPNPTLDFFGNLKGLIRVGPDYFDCLADASEKSGRDITEGRIVLAAEIRREAREAADGVIRNYIKINNGVCTIGHVLKWYIEKLGKGSLQRAKWTAEKIRGEIEVDLEFMKAGGFIDDWRRTLAGFDLIIGGVKPPLPLRPVFGGDN